MKIDSIKANNMINAYNKQKLQSKINTFDKIPQDKVVISGAAKEMNKVSVDCENINLDKVNEIKSRIKQGTYNINSGNIAKKIIEAIKGE